MLMNGVLFSSSVLCGYVILTTYRFYSVNYWTLIQVIVDFKSLILDYIAYRALTATWCN